MSLHVNVCFCGGRITCLNVPTSPGNYAIAGMIRGFLEGEGRQLDWDKALMIYRTYWKQAKTVLLDKSPAFMNIAPWIAKQMRERNLRAAFLVLTHSVCTTRYLAHPPAQTYVTVFFNDSIGGGVQVAPRKIGIDNLTVCVLS